MERNIPSNVLSEGVKEILTLHLFFSDSGVEVEWRIGHSDRHSGLTFERIIKWVPNAMAKSGSPLNPEFRHYPATISSIYNIQRPFAAHQFTMRNVWPSLH